jgi:protein involved in polysaccharide export with SLBB domain
LAPDSVQPLGPQQPIVGPLPTDNGAPQTVVIPAAGAMPPNIPLQPGDVIIVNAADEPALTGQYWVRDDGKIIFPEIGEVFVQGLTSTAVADILMQRLRKFEINPIVAVQATSLVPRVITVIGQLSRPGVYDIRQFQSLIPLLTAAGGFEPGVDLGQAMLLRNGNASRLAIQSTAGGMAIPKEVPLLAGDTLVVPSQGTPIVGLTGALARVGAVPLAAADTASKAVVLSGGILPNADLPSAYLLRDGKHIPLGLDNLIGRNGQLTAAAEIKLEANDIIVVPAKDDSLVYVTGEVRAPGPQFLDKASTVAKAVALASGTTEVANGKDAYLLRRGQRVPVNLDALLGTGETSDDTALQAGDVLFVPKLMRIVAIAGEVQRPGVYVYDQADSMVAAISAAGGPLEDANLEGTVVLRDGKPIPVDIAALLNHADTVANIKLQPGDRIVVPRLLDRVYVMGDVVKPGPLAIQKGDTLIDLLGKAGGVQAGADPNKIMIARRPTEAEMREIEKKVQANQDARLKHTRVPKETTVPENEKLPAQLLADEIVKQNVKLYDLSRVTVGADVYIARAGDVIYVPAKEEHESFWRTALTSFLSSAIVDFFFYRH